MCHAVAHIRLFICSGTCVNEPNSIAVDVLFFFFLFIGDSLERKCTLILFGIFFSLSRLLYLLVYLNMRTICLAHIFTGNVRVRRLVNLCIYKNVREILHTNIYIIGKVLRAQKYTYILIDVELWFYNNNVFCCRT